MSNPDPSANPASPAGTQGGNSPAPQKTCCANAHHAGESHGKSTAKRFFTSLVLMLLVGSIIANVYLGIIVQSFFAGPSEVSYAKGDRDHRIVILPVNGIINNETDDFIRRALQALEDDKPKAIVLRIDSGGGHVGASDRIWERVRSFREQTDIPVVASFGAIAASGGYYIATPADQIYAENTTLTGSIGVIAPGFTLENLLEKLGVNPEVITSTDSTQKDWFSVHREWTDEERQHRRALLDDAYERFIDVIHQTRGEKLAESEIRSLATGAVFSASRAYDDELIDEIGYLDDAIARAAELADIPEDVQPDVRLMQRPQRFGLMNLLHNPQPDLSDLSADRVRDWTTELHTPRLMYHVQ